MNQEQIKQNLSNVVEGLILNLSNSISNFIKSGINDTDLSLNTYTDIQCILNEQYNKFNNQLKESIVIAGGSITSLFLNQEVNDYDIYFKDENAVKALLNFYISIYNKQYNTNWCYSNKLHKIYQLKPAYKNIDCNSMELYSNFNEYCDTIDYLFFKNDSTSKILIGEYAPICITPNAVTLNNKIQLVTRFSGKPEEIISNFDFVHTNLYYDFYQNELVLNTESLQSILTKELIYNGSKFPLCSLFRLNKFLSKGWTISNTELLKISLQIHQLNLLDKSVLKEQLLGFYFPNCFNINDELNKLDEISVEHILEIFTKYQSK